MPKVEAGISINVDSKKHFQDQIKILRQFGVDTQRVFENEAQKTLKDMKTDYPVGAPRDTGRLQTNITAQTNITGGVDFESEAFDPDTGIDYAPIQEESQPYFYKNIRKFNRRLKRTITNLFRTYTSLGGGYRSRLR